MAEEKKQGLKEKLQGYKSIKRQIARKHLDLLEMQKSVKVQDSVKGSSPAFPYQKQTIVMGGWEELGAVQKQRIRECIKEIVVLEKEALEVEKVVRAIEDMLVREAIELHYIKDYTWQKTAFEMGYISDSTPKVMCKRFFDKL